MDDTWYRVSVTLPVALEPLAEHEPSPQAALARRLTDRARAALVRLPARRDPELRDAVALLVEAVEALEDEVAGMRARQALAQRELPLEETRMELGGDGVTLFCTSPITVGGRVLVHLALPGHGGGEVLHAVPGVIVGPQQVDSTVTEVRFETTAHAQPIVAYCFAVQRRERRDELDTLSRARK